MAWHTIYITGNSDFRTEVRKRLEYADPRFMPGYIENSSDLDTHDLYWLDWRNNMRAFKEAIGAKLIWKYRLRFFNSLEAFLEYEDSKDRKDQDEFTPEELRRIAAMHALEDKME
jgi:hypothetical protein